MSVCEHTTHSHQYIVSSGCSIYIPHIGSSGAFSRANVPPGRYVLRIEARDVIAGEKIVLSTVIHLYTSEDQCSTYLINRGLRIHGQNVTVEFASTGHFRGFVCFLNRQPFHCKYVIQVWFLNTNAFVCAGSSPTVLNSLDPGRYSIQIQPLGCERFQQWKKVFYIV